MWARKLETKRVRPWSKSLTWSTKLGRLQPPFFRKSNSTTTAPLQEERFTRLATIIPLRAQVWKRPVWCRSLTRQQVIGLRHIDARQSIRWPCRCGKSGRHDLRGRWRVRTRPLGFHGQVASLRPCQRHLDPIGEHEQRTPFLPIGLLQGETDRIWRGCDLL